MSTKRAAAAVAESTTTGGGASDQAGAADVDAGADTASTPADEQGAEAAPPETARGVLQRRENVDGVWYAHGVVLTAPASLCEALRLDGALDMHPNAIDYALSSGAPQVTHEPPAPADL